MAAQLVAMEALRLVLQAEALAVVWKGVQLATMGALENYCHCQRHSLLLALRAKVHDSHLH